ncbi:MAG: sigma-70 family RNA polymerase sigma factor [Anaerolineae bacterium]|nr:sigma-70 family RNA polymerase sigma factor [Anaerolineae bacterium]
MKKPHRADQRLLQLAIEGDREAFGELYERYLGEIYRYVYFRVSDEREAEDITAEAFLKTWEHLPRLARKNASIRSFRNWLYRVARNRVIDHYRKKKPVPLPDGLQTEGDLVREAVEANSQVRRLTGAIRQLSSDYQHVIILRFINQFSHAECAEVMGRTEGQTRILQYRALKKLREIMDIDDEPTDTR